MKTPKSSLLFALCCSTLTVTGCGDRTASTTDALASSAGAHADALTEDEHLWPEGGGGGGRSAGGGGDRGRTGGGDGGRSGGGGGGGRTSGGGGGGWNNSSSGGGGGGRTSGGGGGGGWNNSSTGGGGGSTSSNGGSTGGGGGGGNGSTTGSGGSTTGSGTTTGSGGGTTSGGTTGASSTGRESWVWVYANWSTSLSSIAANPSAFTHISPTFYSLNYNYASGVAYYSNCSTQSGTYNCVDAGANNFSGMTTQQFTQKVSALGMATVPAIYAGAGNGGSDTAVQSILNSSSVASSFISAMVTEAVNNGYAGYNLDWEVGTTTGSAYADKFVSFVNTFKQALSAHNMSLSVDVIVSNINGTWCSSNNGIYDFAKLSTSSIDRLIIEDYTPALGSSTSCQQVALSSSSPASCPLNSNGSNVTATGLFDFMCSNLPASMVVIGLESYSTGTNPIAGQAFSIMKTYKFDKVAIWPQIEGSYPFLSAQGLVASQSDWYSILSNFLKGN